MDESNSDVTFDVARNVPQDAAGWLVSQGWQIVGIMYDYTTIPATASLTLARFKMIQRLEH